jgi:hypothetical protein
MNNEKKIYGKKLNQNEIKKKCLKKSIFVLHKSVQIFFYLFACSI